MIEAIMYLAIGFCAAGLSMLLFVPLVHDRAVRLTARRLDAAQPASLAEIVAAKDLQRADFAMATRRLEFNLDELKTKDASRRAELGRKTENLNRLQLENEGFREKLRRTEQNCRAKAKEVGELQRVVGQNECALADIRSVLKATREQLVEERSKFTSFQDQLADRVRQGTAEISQERVIGRQLQQDLQRWLLSAAPTARPRRGFNHS